jgi:glycosyltransferase involved in cell wall biosynthesis
MTAWQCPEHMTPDRPLNVCFVSSDYPTVSLGGIGGIGAHTSALAHGVADLGHRVSVITEGGKEIDRHWDGSVAVIALPKVSGRLWKLAKVIPLQWIRRTMAVADTLRVMHTQQPFDIISFPDGYGEGFRYSFAPATPFAVQLFGPASLVQRWDGRHVPPLRARVESWMERRPAAHARLLISATRAFAKTIADEWSIAEDRIRVIRNPLNVDLFRPSHSSEPVSSKRILFVGHLQGLKGVEVLAKAIPHVVRLHPTAEFQLIGNDTRSAPGGGSMLKRLADEIATAEVLDRVHFSEPIPQRDLVPLYQSCAVFVLPSLNDVYPNAVLEAMACARPCVVTSSVGVAELVRESRCGTVVPPNDPVALAGALSDLLALPAHIREEMGARGRRIVEQACALEVIAAQTVQAYRDVIAPDFSTWKKPIFERSR